MREKQKACSVGGTTEQAAEQVQASRQGHASKINFTTAAEVRQIQVSDFLLRGAENAAPRRHLRQMTGLTDRDLRRRIQEERLAGTPILSSNTAGGYYLPADDLERQEFIRSMRGRAREIEAVAAAVEGADV